LPDDEQFYLWTNLHTSEVVRQAILKTAGKNLQLGKTMTAEHKVTLTLECGHTRKYPKGGIHRSKETWIIEHPTKVTAETAPVGIVNGSDNQVDDTGQQYHDPGYAIGNDPFGFAIEGTSRYGNGSEDSIIAKIDAKMLELKAASRDCLVIGCIGADNYRWLTGYYGRLGNGTLTNAEHQRCFRLFEKIRNSLKTP
jgi:hypothetical protein